MKRETVSEEQKIFENICSELCLGRVRGKAKRVYGGYMHKMYRLKTDKGEFAVKLLNPVIMKRPDVFDNFAQADALERKLLAADIPIVPSMEFNGKKMQCIQNRYFYVFEWINGKALSTKRIKETHCEIIGGILAKIHKIESVPKSIDIKKLEINWGNYLSLAEKNCPKVAAALSDCTELLYKSQQEYNDAVERLPQISCICNGDMDSKNVLWAGNKPKIIDLECLNYGNPYTELFQLALCWSGYEHCRINFSLLKAFVQSYMCEYGRLDVDWNVLYCSNAGRLEWLEYNVKRALMLECENEEERTLGIKQAEETVNHIIYYDRIRETLINQLESYTS